MAAVLARPANLVAAGKLRCAPGAVSKAPPAGQPGIWQRFRASMTRLVMKFGGTSVADLQRIRRVARLVTAEVNAGHQVAVVVSAMSGKTNELVAWTDDAAPAAQGLPPSDDEYDVVVASGEQVTAGLLAMA